MGDWAKVGLEDDFLARLQSLSDGSTGVSIQQFEFPDSLTPSQLNQLVNIASKQRGIWEAEYMFSPASAPNAEAKAELECWRDISERLTKKLVECVPGLREQVERKCRAISALPTVEKSLDHNRKRPLSKCAAAVLSRIAIGFNEIGFDNVGEYLYKIALFPKGTIGRNPDFTRKQLNPTKVLVLIDREIERIRARIKEGLNECAKGDAVIPTDKVLDGLDELKSSYQGTNREQYFAEIDKIKQGFLEKYGTSIPVDEAYKILTDYEQKYGL